LYSITTNKERYHLRSNLQTCLPWRADVWMERGARIRCLLAAPIHNRL